MATTEEKYAVLVLMRQLEHALRGYYNQHQATGCECELCKEAERAFVVWKDLNS
jgi:hypothetical protein